MEVGEQVAVLVVPGNKSSATLLSHQNAPANQAVDRLSQSPDADAKTLRQKLLGRQHITRFEFALVDGLGQLLINVLVEVRADVGWRVVKMAFHVVGVCGDWALRYSTKPMQKFI